MKHNVGDKVKVREDLKAGKSYGNILFSGDMEKFLGKETEITMIEEIFPGCECYNLKNCDYYNFTDEMLEPTASPLWTLTIRPDGGNPDITVGLLKETGKANVMVNAQKNTRLGAAMSIVSQLFAIPTTSASKELRSKVEDEKYKQIVEHLNENVNIGVHGYMNYCDRKFYPEEAIEVYNKFIEQCRKDIKYLIDRYKPAEPEVKEPPKAEPKPEPIMIGGKELKEGSRVILKKWDDKDNHCYIGRKNWDKLCEEVLTVASPCFAKEKVLVRSKNSCGTWFVPHCTIDRILEEI